MSCNPPCSGCKDMKMDTKPSNIPVTEKEIISLGKSTYSNRVELVSVYNPHNLPPLSTKAISRKVGLFNLLVLDRFVYVIGGCNDEGIPVRNVYRILIEDHRNYNMNPSTFGGCLIQKWKEVKKLLFPRKNFASVAFNGHIYVVGGQGFGYITYSFGECYNPLEDEWEAIACLRVCRKHLQLVTRSGTEIYAIGGVDSTGKVTNVFEKYNFVNKRWDRKTDMIFPRYLFASTSLYDKVYVIGGKGNLGMLVDAIESYDVVASQWNIIKAGGVCLWGLSAVVFEEQIIVVGGYNEKNEIIRKVQTFNLENASFESLEDISEEIEVLPNCVAVATLE